MATSIGDPAIVLSNGDILMQIQNSPGFSLLNLSALSRAPYNYLTQSTPSASVPYVIPFQANATSQGSGLLSNISVPNSNFPLLVALITSLFPYLASSFPSSVTQITLNANVAVPLAPVTSSVTSSATTTPSSSSASAQSSAQSTLPVQHPAFTSANGDILFPNYDSVIQR